VRSILKFYFNAAVAQVESRCAIRLQIRIILDSIRTRIIEPTQRSRQDGINETEEKEWMLRRGVWVGSRVLSDRMRRREHAVSSASDVGEFEVEQFYVDRQLSDAVTLRAGLFLMPFGLLNEHHEPTNFYGVQRNFVETLIIPSTWREGGFNVHGDTESGFSWNAGLTTGFDLSKWTTPRSFRNIRPPSISRTATRRRCNRRIKSWRSPMRTT